MRRVPVWRVSTSMAMLEMLRSRLWMEGDGRGEEQMASRVNSRTFRDDVGHFDRFHQGHH